MKRKLRKIDKFLEIPKEIYSNDAKITIIGFDEVIIDYEEFFVRIKTNNAIVNLHGYGFNLVNLSNVDIKVTGKVESIELERIVEENEC